MQSYILSLQKNGVLTLATFAFLETNEHTLQGLMILITTANVAEHMN